MSEKLEMSDEEMKAAAVEVALLVNRFVVHSGEGTVRVAFLEHRPLPSGRDAFVCRSAVAFSLANARQLADVLSKITE